MVQAAAVAAVAAAQTAPVARSAEATKPAAMEAAEAAGVGAAEAAAPLWASDVNLDVFSWDLLDSSRPYRVDRYHADCVLGGEAELVQGARVKGGLVDGVGATGGRDPIDPKLSTVDGVRASVRLSSASWVYCRCSEEPGQAVAPAPPSCWPPTVASRRAITSAGPMPHAPISSSTSHPAPSVPQSFAPS